MTALNYQVGLIVLLSIVLAVLLVNAWIQRRQLKTLLNELSKLNHTSAYTAIPLRRLVLDCSNSNLSTV